VSEGAFQRRIPASYGADSALAAPAGGNFSLGESAFAFTIPVLRADERLDGVVVARGGPSAGTRWIADSAGLQWTAALDRLRSADSSAASGRDSRIARGAVRVIPTSRGAVLAQSSYLIRPQNPPSLNAVSLLRADSVRSGSTLTAALGQTNPANTPLAPPSDLRAAAAALYDSLRADQRRGDWRAFGDHWDSLGRLLGRAPR
jgi:hypothetical protein